MIGRWRSSFLPFSFDHKISAPILVSTFQLEDNSRLWGREKEELLRRITELERGFARSPVMILGHPSLAHATTHPGIPTNKVTSVCTLNLTLRSQVI